MFSEEFEFITPDYTLIEINKHKDEIKQKAKVTEEEFQLLLTLIFEKIEIIPQSAYSTLLTESQNDLDDKNDLPHLASALACKADGIWAHDSHFLKQKKIKVLTNIGLT